MSITLPKALPGEVYAKLVEERQGPVIEHEPALRQPNGSDRQQDEAASG